MRRQYTSVSLSPWARFIQSVAMLVKACQKAFIARKLNYVSEICSGESDLQVDTVCLMRSVRIF